MLGWLDGTEETEGWRKITRVSRHRLKKIMLRLSNSNSCEALSNKTATQKFVCLPRSLVQK